MVLWLIDTKKASPVSGMEPENVAAGMPSSGAVNVCPPMVATSTFPTKSSEHPHELSTVPRTNVFAIFSLFCEYLKRTGHIPGGNELAINGADVDV